MVTVESQSLLVLKTSEDIPGRREWDAMGWQQAEHRLWN